MQNHRHLCPADRGLGIDAHIRRTAYRAELKKGGDGGTGKGGNLIAVGERGEQRVGSGGQALPGGLNRTADHGHSTLTGDGVVGLEQTVFTLDNSEIPRGRHSPGVNAGSGNVGETDSSHVGLELEGAADHKGEFAAADPAAGAKLVIAVTVGNSALTEGFAQSQPEATSVKGVVQ